MPPPLNADGTLVSKIQKARRTVLELLAAQGMDTTEYAHFSRSEVHIMYEHNQLDLLVTSRTDSPTLDPMWNPTWTEAMRTRPRPPEETRTYLRGGIDKKWTETTLNECVFRLFQLEGKLTPKDTLILMANGDWMDSLKAAAHQWWTTHGIFIVLWPLKRLQFNILHHEAVPHHRVLSHEEAMAVRTQFGIRNDLEFPEMDRFDPVAQVIGLRPGELVEILRPSPTGILTPFWKRCVSIIA
jgi:DNA-directed RNA polymerase subunit H